MPNALRMAVERFFGTLQAGGQAAGLEYEEVTSRAIFKGKPVADLVASIRALENLNGRERWLSLAAIYHKNRVNQRIVVGHYGSLRKLAAREGIAPRAVGKAMYRDEADVLHDLDLIGSKGTVITFSTLKNGYRQLYETINATGWGAERLQVEPVYPSKYPPCNPNSGLLRDRMIVLRRTLRIGVAIAAGKVGISTGCWIKIETGKVKPKAASIEKIERLLPALRRPHRGCACELCSPALSPTRPHSPLALVDAHQHFVATQERRRPRRIIVGEERIAFAC